MVLVYFRHRSSNKRHLRVNFFLKNKDPWVLFQQWRPEAHLRQAAQRRCGPTCSRPKVNISRRALRVLDQVYIVPQVCSRYWSNRDPWAAALSSFYFISAALIWRKLLYSWRIKTPGYYFCNEGPKPTCGKPRSGAVARRVVIPQWTFPEGPYVYWTRCALYPGIIDTSVSKGLGRVREGQEKRGIQVWGVSNLNKARRNRDPWTVALSSFSLI